MEDHKKLQNRRRDNRLRLNKMRGYDTSNKPNFDVAIKIRQLRSEGFTWTALSRISGVSKATLINIVQRVYTTTDWRVHARLLNLDTSQVFKQAEAGERVPAYATQRRIQALQRIGWSFRRLDNIIHERDNISLYRCRTVLKSDTVLIETHNEIKAIFEELQMKEGGDQNRVNYATNKGWAPPLAWDNIEDRNEKPKGVWGSKQTSDSKPHSIVERECGTCGGKFMGETFRKFCSRSCGAKSSNANFSHTGKRDRGRLRVS